MPVSELTEPAAVCNCATETNSLSRSTTGFVPRMSCHHCIAEPSTIRNTSTRNEAAITASNRHTEA